MDLNTKNGSNYLTRKFPKGIGPAMYPLAAYLNEVGKNESWTSEGAYQTLRTSASNGASTNFATAAKNQAPGNLSRFFIEAKWFEYSLGQISREIISKSKDEGAVANVIDGETQSAMRSESMGLSVGLHGNGGGALCAIVDVATGVDASGNSLTNSLLTCKFGSDGARIQEGMTLQASKDDGAFYITSAAALGGTLGSGATVKVIGVDFNPGGTTKIQVDTDCVSVWGSFPRTAGVGGWYLFREGDYANKMPGLDAWCPPANPGSTTYVDALGQSCTIPDTFSGVKRSASPQKLGGIRYAAGGISKEEAIIQAAYKLPNFGVKGPLVAVCNFNDLMKLQLTLRAKATLPSASDPGMGFASVTLDGPTGKIKVLGDVYRPEGSFKLLNPSAFKLISAGGIDFVTMNGDKLFIDPNSDGYYFRVAGYVGTWCDAPMELLHGTW